MEKLRFDAGDVHLEVDHYTVNVVLWSKAGKYAFEF